MKFSVLEVSDEQGSVGEGQDPVAVGLVVLVVAFVLPAVVELQFVVPGSYPVLEVALEHIAVRVPLLASSRQLAQEVLA